MWRIENAGEYLHVVLMKKNDATDEFSLYMATGRGFLDVTKPGAKQFPGWPVTVKP